MYLNSDIDIKSYNSDNIIIIKDIKNFNPKHIFDCGQCFRWYPDNDGSWTGVAFGHVINVLTSGKELIIKNCSFNDFKKIWYTYFDLKRDYEKIKEKLTTLDSIMKKAVEFGWGIRLLKQELWEVFLSFIISQNNNIPRIKGIIERLAKQFGTPVEYNNTIYYTFPDPKSLFKASIDKISACRAGYRCRYIKNAADSIYLKQYNLNKLLSMDLEDIRQYLKQITGIGDKVCDCIILFSGINYSVFPTDRWIKRIIQELYFEKAVPDSKIKTFVQNHFGPLAGFAQQYLFYYAKENKIGMKTI